jgi:hypothetical protein
MTRSIRALAVSSIFLFAGCGTAGQPASNASNGAAATILSTATVAPSPTPATPSPTATLRFEVASDYFRAVPGYEWVLPPAELNGITQALETGELAKFVANPAAIRLITKQGEQTSMVLLVLPLSPSYAALPGALDSVAQGYSSNKPSELTIGGRRALLFQKESNKDFKSLTWLHRSFLVWLYGFNTTTDAAMTAFATEVVAANN